MSAYEQLRKDVIRAVCLGEEDRRTSLPLELELQSRWMAGEFGREFVTLDGQSVIIRDWGHWNRGAGPDFVRAAVEISGEIRLGSIELDREPLDWERHGHREDENFADVVLHVSFSPAKAEFFVRTCEQKFVPRVEISPEHWSSVVRVPMRETARAFPGRCSRPLATLPELAVRGLIEQAAEWRLREKSRAWAASVEAVGREQAIFQHVAEALGYRANRWAMRCLAQRLPLGELLRSEQREEILWGSSGFLLPDWGEKAADAARPRWRNLWDAWWKVRADWENARDLPWKFHGARPANHPHRRLAALGAVLDRWKECVALWENPDRSVDEFLAFFISLQHEFWSFQHSWGSQPSSRKIALVGDSHARQILANVWAPAYWCEHGAISPAYQSVRGGASNEALHRVAIRLFGSEILARPWLKSLHHQQGLLQIDRDFCLEDASDCVDCPFPEQLAQWRGGLPET